MDDLPELRCSLLEPGCGRNQNKMRTIRFLCHGVMLLGAAAPLAAFGQFLAPTPEELNMTSDPKAPGAAAVFLSREETEDDPHHFSTVHARIKVLTEQGKDAATVHIAYPRFLAFSASGNNQSSSSSGMENHFDLPNVNALGADQPWDTDTFKGDVKVASVQARIIHPDGSIVAVKGSTGELVKVNKDGNGATLTVPGVGVGDIVEYYYQVGYDRFQSAPNWQIQQQYFVHKAHYKYTPSGKFLTSGITTDAIGNSELKGPHDTVLNDIRRADILPPGKQISQDALGNYFLDLTDIPAIPNEPFAPPVGERIYQADFYYTYTVVQNEFWQQEMQFWTKDLNRYIAPTATIKSTAEELVSGSDSPLDKAKKLYAAVEKMTNTDLAADSSSTPSTSIPAGSVQTILEQRSGNSKELALLYLSLARAAGLNARPQRIASRDRHVFSPQFLSTSQLDGIVIGLTIDGKETLVDPGQKMVPFQTLYWAHAGAGGVALNEKGKVETLITPLQLNTDNAVLRVGTLNVSSQGAVSGTLKVGFTGAQALEWRLLALRTDANTVQQQLEKTIAGQVPDGIVAHVTNVAGLDDPGRQLVAVIQVTGSIADQSGKHLTLPRLFFDSKETDPFPAQTTRTLPVDMQYPAQENEKITYVFPSGFALDGTPPDANFKWGDNAIYELRSKTAAGSITTGRLLARGFTLLDPADYGNLQDFYQKVISSDKQKIALGASQAGN